MASKLFLAALLSTAALAAPLEERQNCASLYGQCGGQGWSGPTCCASGSTCQVGNPWYSQCLPGGNQPPPPSTPTQQPPAPGTTTTRPPTNTATAPQPPAPTGTGAPVTGNPFAGVQMWANSYYRRQIVSSAVPALSGPMATAAAKLADVPSFEWMDTRAKVPLVDVSLGEVRAANQAGGNYAAILVVYNLPDRDCAAAASNGELAIADDGVNKYKAYIDSIRAMLIKYSDIRVNLVIEPDSLANMVTNMNVPKCQGAAAAYRECTLYAIRNLDLPNVSQYLDAGHAGWLGWPANLPGTAELFGKLYQDAGKPRSLRGFATNVSNFNSWAISTPPSYTTPNPNFNEKLYIEALVPLLRAQGWENPKFIVDQGRSGKQPTGQLEWGHWCNSLGTGFGPRPTANTGHPDVDAFVWIKPGGECDGTSDTTAARYDHFCGVASAMKPAPEAGQWFQAYFEMLLQNANPSFL